MGTSESKLGEQTTRPTAGAADRVVILGAGPAGLTAAWTLARQGRGVAVFEEDPRYVGGIARTVEQDGYRFDIGGHRFFSKSAEVNRLWQEILGEEFLERPRLSRIYYRDKFFNYPLEPLDAFVKLGPVETARVMLSYLQARLSPHPLERSFEEWVVNRFGRRLFQIFFQSYTEKVWGIPCSEITADWAAQRIKGLSLVEAVRNAFGGGRIPAKAKSLIRSFHYPRLGPGQMWEAAARQIVSAGGAIHMGHRAGEIHWKDDRVLSVVGTAAEETRWECHGTDFISSIPLRELVLGLRPSPPDKVLEAARGLRYRDFVIVCLVVNREHIFPDNWIYIHDPSVQVGRVQNFKNWSPHLVPDSSKTSLGLEYFCFEDDALWSMTSGDLQALASREIHSIGLARPEEIERAFIVRMPKAYPIYDSGYHDRLDIIRNWLGRLRNLQPVGRNGMHRYNNQDHSMMTALLAARNLAGAQFDPWKVNTDAEYLEEESSPIPESSASVRHTS